MDGFNFYFINLDRSTERLKRINKLYDINNLVRVPAYDGEKLQFHDDIKFNENFLIKKNVKRSELGCSLSHLKAIKMAYESNDENIFIIEDDTLNVYKSIWEKPLKQIIADMPKNTECLIFYSSNPSIKQNMKRNRNMEFVPFTYTWSTGCYFLTKTAIEKLYKKYVKNGIIDVRFAVEKRQILSDGELIFPQLKTYVYNRPTFIDECKSSTIHETNVTVHEIANEMTIDWLVEMVLERELT